MNDGDSLRHLLDSPIDDPKRPKESGTTAGIPGGIWFVGAMLVGGLLVFAGYLIGGRDATPIVADEETTTTTTEPVTATGLPAGFVPLDSRFGGRVERVLFGLDGVHVTISTVSTFSIEGESSAFVGGNWDLILKDGTRMSSVNQVSDSLVPGYLTMRFDLGEYEPDDIESIQHTALAIQTSDGIGLDVGEYSFPSQDSLIEFEHSLEHRTPGGATLTVSDLRLSPSGGDLRWSIAGPGDPTARVSLSVWAYPADGQGYYLPGRTGQEPFFGFGFGLSDGPWLKQGEVVLLAREMLPIEEPLVVTIEVHITWLTFSPVSAPPIPIGDAPVVVVD
ncbi:MAG TPA: hypothetical protein VMM81_02105 [Acidimicrobiia bacterium]|nr:hypothetical protein [Acidimicrobiia bacterium]